MTPFLPSETAPIRDLLLKHPKQAWVDQDHVRRQWRELNYAAEPSFEDACAEYDKLTAILDRHAGRILFLPEDGRTGLDSIYVRDAACEAPRGLVIGRMGKPARRGEPEAVRDFCLASGWPVAGEILAPGTLEGGDLVWLDAKTAAVGHGYRTNAEGIRQFRALVAADGCEVIEVPLPHWDGPGDVLHLMSLLSPVGERTLLVYSRLLAVPFRNRLKDMGFQLLEVPDEEYATMATNVLALAPGTCLALAGNPRTAGMMKRVGREVLTYEGREISAKGAGGPTCLTRPLRRGR
jgi:N-dimethylarginine dimethylaminohydrolase